MAKELDQWNFLQKYKFTNKETKIAVSETKHDIYDNLKKLATKKGKQEINFSFNMILAFHFNCKRVGSVKFS